MDGANEMFYKHSRDLMYHRYGKRIIDILGSASLLFFLFPLLILFSITLFLFSGRPIFFTQKRTGLHNTPFVIWKFRTMKKSPQKTDNRNTVDHEYEWKREVPIDFEFAKPDHLNVTQIGKIYRKYSIDEIPQLWNVLKGDMSLIGPRPEILEITMHYSDKQKKRLLVKPGLTGYAQIHGRSNITHGEKIAHDLYYVKHYSFLLDLKIILSTVLIVITGKGAY